MPWGFCKSLSRNSFPLSENSSPSRTPEIERPSHDATVQAIQFRLKELGYNVTLADGFLGSRTRAAIEAYQRDQGLAVDGDANVALLRRLEFVAQNNNNSKPKDISALPFNPKEQQLQTPDNSYINSGGWHCKAGYRKVGNDCTEIIPPANAYISGKIWQCKTGYRKIAGGCEEINIPTNGYLSGGDWQCKTGYIKVGDKCMQN